MPDFLLPYQVHSGYFLQRAWTLRFIQKKSFKHIQSTISFNETGGVSIKTIKRWERFWKQKESDLINQLYQSLIELDPDLELLYRTKHLTIQQTLIYLIRRLWKILHPTIPYPFCGFFTWINQLIHK